MKYGQISGNSSINNMIYRCFEFLHDGDARKFVRKFEHELNDNTQVLHTFRELILGAFLASNGFDVRHEHVLAGKYPDWCILNESSAPQAIVELTNFHVDQASEIKIETSRRASGMWFEWMPNNASRLYESIRRKANVYKDLVEESGCPYVIAVFGEFTAAVNSDELNESLYAGESGIFVQHEWVSGVLFFEEQSGLYRFTYLPNPIALRNIYIPNGSF